MHDNSDVAGAANQLEISFGGETIGHGHLMEDRKRFMVYRGSRVRVAETKTIPSSVKRKRAELLDLGRLVLDGKFYRLTEDEEFSSISNAAGVLLGRSANGKMEWRESSELDAEVESTAPKTSKISNLRSGSEELEIEDCALSNEGQSDLSKSVNMDRINEPTELVEIKQGRKVVARGKVQRPGAKEGERSGPGRTSPIVVLKGASFRVREAKSLSAPYRRLREELFANPDLFDELPNDIAVNARRELKKDHKFSSLSAAASSVLGVQVNGRDAWIRVEENQDSSPAPLSGITLHFGFQDGGNIVEAIRNGSNRLGAKWKMGPFPVPYTGISRVVNRDSAEGKTVGRRTAFPSGASSLLSLEVDRDTNRASCTRFYLDLRENPQQFEDAPSNELVTILGVEALLDVNSTKRLNAVRGSSDLTQPVVFVFHLGTDDDVISGQLAQQLGLWLYGEESIDFEGYLSNFIASITDAKMGKLALGDEMPAFATLCVAPSADGDAVTIGNEELFDLASLRAPAANEGENATASERKSASYGLDRLVEWHDSSRAVFKRSAMVVAGQAASADLDTSAPTAMESSSVYSDVVALTMLEHLTLNKFLEESHTIANGLLDVANRNDESSLHQADRLEELQREYMANSVSYGKLHIVMRSNGGDIYRALRVRWHLESLRNEISEEIARLSEHVGTLADRSRDRSEKVIAEVQRKAAERKQARDKVIDEKQRIRESTISTSLAFVAVVIGAPALSDFAANLWGWPPLITFLGTCVFAVAGIFALPPLMRRLEDRKNGERERASGEVDPAQ